MSIKYIFITGGVVSSLGKGLTTAAIGNLLEARGLNIAILKLDPYLNVDPGTMNPFQHGEVYVTDDGSETDLDLGHYYRFTKSPLSKVSNATSGQIYETVIKKERKGEYLGKTVQVIPHITDEIKNRITAVAKQSQKIDVVLIEIGGTVGDIECLPFLEAIRQFRYEHHDDCVNIHLTYVPYLKAAGEVKTKPSQHSAMILREIGIIPDMILCRCEQALSDEIKEKISLFCNVLKQDVFDEKDVDSTIYEVPLELHKQGLDERILTLLSLPAKQADLSAWKEMVAIAIKPKQKLKIGVVGKYVDLNDAYKSIYEALYHASIAAHVDLDICKIESDKVDHESQLEKCDGYLVPGGFGQRGWLGKIFTAKYCRENNIPFFGVCLGMQIMIVEFARNVLGKGTAHSVEVDPHTEFPVISLMEEQKKIEKLGATMRLGSYPCLLKPESKAYLAYGKKVVQERHRHRYEFNNEFKEEFEKHGMVFAGTLNEGSLCEIAEISHHPWMVGVQFHPEFKSKPLEPHPLFTSFINAAKEAKWGKS
ncbi:MAG: CTP synthetase [Chlamydiae bacterium CG10_big_fil_rev_8_21_14_0_10_35_9]|nr:MAG: CTP synthetase [Chlamydiae bacterium CG10_big_fil_rev_8_21_14_0_10_35_9]